MNKTQLAEKRYLEEQIKEDYKNYNNQLQKTKKTTKLQKKKQHEINERRALFRKQNELNEEKKQYEGKQKRKYNRWRY